MYSQSWILDVTVHETEQRRYTRETCKSSWSVACQTLSSCTYCTRAKRNLQHMVSLAHDRPLFYADTSYIYRYSEQSARIVNPFKSTDCTIRYTRLRCSLEWHMINKQIFKTSWSLLCFKQLITSLCPLGNWTSQALQQGLDTGNMTTRDLASWLLR